MTKIEELLAMDACELERWLSHQRQVIREVLEHTQGTLTYRPCKCSGLRFPHRPGSKGCQMDPDVARILNRYREKGRRYYRGRRTCWCNAYSFPHRVGGGKCERLRWDPLIKEEVDQVSDPGRGDDGE